MTTPVPTATRRQTAIGVFVLFAGLLVLGVLMNANNQDGKSRLSEYCRTEGTHIYRGAIDDERMARYVNTCQ